MTPPFKSFSLGFRLLLIFSLFFFNWFIITKVSSYVLHSVLGFDNLLDMTNMTNLSPQEVNTLIVMQGFGTIIGFMLTAMMFSVLESGQFSGYLGINRSISLKMLLLAIVSMLVAQFFITALVDLNNKIPIPSSLNFLKDIEKSDQDLTNAFLNFKSFSRFLVITLVLAVIPAIGEEMFFRGLILGDLLKAKVKPAVAIIITGLLFALIHFEFQNTLSIWVLGCFLGYLYYISGSLWLSIAAHFVNNILDILLKYLYNIGILKTDISESSVPVYLTVLSIIIFAACLYLFNKWKVQPSFVEEEFTNEEAME